MANPVIHFEIGGRDLDAAANFFSTVFGWASEPYNEVAYRVAAGTPSDLTGAVTAIPDGPGPYVMIYIQVEDIPHTLDKIVEAGGGRVLGPLPTPDGDQFAWFKDPSGNTLGLLQKSG